MGRGRTSTSRKGRGKALMNLGMKRVKEKAWPIIKRRRCKGALLKRKRNGLLMEIKLMKMLLII